MTATTRAPAVSTAHRSYLVGLIGTGIGPSLTPSMHEREAAELHHRLVYRTVDLAELGLAPDSVVDLVRAARQLGFDGLNVTHPCKQLVLPGLDRLTPDAAALGAVNTVVFESGRTVGHNTDWSAFARCLERGLPDVPRDRVVVLGAGGAGAAVVHALLGSGVREVAVVDTRVERARELVERLSGHHPGAVCRAAGTDALEPLLSRADGMVNATPIGMARHPGTPVPADLLRPSLWVADIVYRPLRTELLALAEDRGCPTVGGGEMAVFQASQAFGLFTGLEPDTERMLAHFHGLIA
ncbi:shikimate dehydrogenase [Nocardiopsis sp. EMB25]|uniref:shikimate dehydrogenase n=1 Tax=Nocardiopsis sp. EMB25 TaxID=2835867 RepID=UPI002283DFFE|nr:shikimate dehydrogenase [Nocardiopsis sp. EMB25]MCY9783284.1 shikimate dehydrogenase [Nocardiopsis sp. EMB25]